MAQLVIADVLGAGLLALLLTFCGSFWTHAILDRTRKPRKAPKPAVDPIADLLETKASIRNDERRRWAEAWQLASGAPDLGTAIGDVLTMQTAGLAEQRKRQIERDRVAAVEAAEAERKAREETIACVREERDRIEAEHREHQARLAARRARYAQRKSSR